MKIALDYDQTYTLQPCFWDDFIHTARINGYDIRVVTVRHPELDTIPDVGIPVVYTNGVAKKFFCEHYAHWEPDVWIDDKPENILNNSTKTKEWLAEWRANR